MEKIFVLGVIFVCLIGCRPIHTIDIKQIEKGHTTIESLNDKINDTNTLENKSVNKVSISNYASGLNSIIECVNAVPGITLTEYNIIGEDTIKISFDAEETIDAFDFDEKLREHFSFNRTFYSANKSSFSLELKMQEDEKHYKKVTKEISRDIEFQNIIEEFNEDLPIEYDIKDYIIEKDNESSKFKEFEIYTVRLANPTGTLAQFYELLTYIENNENAIQIKGFSFKMNKVTQLNNGQIKLQFYFNKPKND